MNRKILIVGLLVSVMLLIPINSAYSNNSLSVKKNDENLPYDTMLNDTWVKTYDKNRRDSGHSVQQTSDGGYIVVATSEEPISGFEYDWIFKADSNGNIIWEKTYTIDFYSSYHANSVIVSNDNNIVITGIFNFGDVWLLKLDNDGNQIWSKTFDLGEGHEVIQTSDGGYAIVGKYDDIFLLKTDSNGNISWIKTYDNKWYDVGISLKQTFDDGYILLGHSCGKYGESEPSRAWLIKTDENGTLLWDKEFSGKGEALSESIDIAKDGGYFITGSTSKYPDTDFMDIWLLKTDENGILLWEKTFGTPDSDWGQSVLTTDDGGCIVVGSTDKSTFNSDAILIKTDNLGNVEWSKTYGGSYFDGANSVQHTNDAGYIITGNFDPCFGFIIRRDNVFLIKTDSNGKAPPLSKTKDIGIRNRVFDVSFLTLLFEKLFNIWRHILL